LQKPGQLLGEYDVFEEEDEEEGVVGMIVILMLMT